MPIRTCDKPSRLMNLPTRFRTSLNYFTKSDIKHNPNSSSPGPRPGLGLHGVVSVVHTFVIADHYRNYIVSVILSFSIMLLFGVHCRGCKPCPALTFLRPLLVSVARSCWAVSVAVWSCLLCVVWGDTQQLTTGHVYLQGATPAICSCDFLCFST